MVQRPELNSAYPLDRHAERQRRVVDASLQVRPVARALAAIGLAMPLGVSWAATIQVNSALDTTGNAAICTLRDAIASANTDAAVGGCTAGAGADQVSFSLAAGTVISLMTPLPAIYRELSIDGGGGIVIERSPAAPPVLDFHILRTQNFFGEFPLSVANLTLSNGLLTFSNSGGAGLRANVLSSVTLTNVKLQGNHAQQGDGGGAEIFDVSGNVTLDRVTALDNSAASGNGGGVAISRVGGAVVVRESSFVGNTAQGSGGGALISSFTGSGNVSRSEFVSNAANLGAGLSITGTFPATVDTTYIGNNVSDVSNGLYLLNANTMSVVQSWIADNRVSTPGATPAAVAADAGTRNVRIIDSTIGPGPGSAMYAYNVPRILFENSTVSGHLDANVVAAITFENSPGQILAEFRNSTISNNSRGLGSFIGLPQIKLTNSILSGNPGGDAQGVGNVVSDYSLLGTSVPFTGGDNLIADTPGLYPLATTYNANRTAGPTSNQRTIPVHRPLQNSIAIDSADPLFAGSPARDQVGNARVRTGNSGTLRLDMGAVEVLVPRVSVNDGSALEGTAAPNNVSFTVSLSELPDPGFDVAVDYRTVDDSAVGGSDYVARSGTVTFSNSGNVVSQIINVPTIADSVVEPDESFTLHLNNVSNALFAPAANNVTELIARGTIINDDVAMLSIGNASTVEGGNAVFTVSLSSPLPNTVSVMYATAGGTASSGTDFTPASGTVTFLPGETSKVVAVQTIDDLIVEPTETFTVTLSNAISATIAQGTGTGSIIDNDFGNAITVVGVGPVTTTYEPAGNCAVTLGVQGVVGLGAGTLVLPNPVIPPVGQSMPYGMQQTELFTCVGGSVNVTVTWPGAFESHWKWGATTGSPTPHWYPIATTPMGPNTVRFTITDGGFGDNDLTANGRIVDPYAAAVAAAVPPVPAGGGWWGGLAAAISALLGTIGLRSLRRRRDS